VQVNQVYDTALCGTHHAAHAPGCLSALLHPHKVGTGQKMVVLNDMIAFHSQSGPLTLPSTSRQRRQKGARGMSLMVAALPR
jgi:hypothetical protein